MKILSLLFMSFFIKNTFCICYNENDVISKGYTTYKNKVYDISNYNHPGGASTLFKAKGKALESFFNDPKYDFHLDPSSQTFPDLNELYIGDLCQYDGEYETISFNNMIFRYLVVNDSLKIIAETQMLYPTKQWIGIGFPKVENQMIDSSVVIGIFDSNNTKNNVIKSFYIDSTVKTNPLNILKNQILNFTHDESIEFENKKVILKFGINNNTKITNFIYAIGNKFTSLYISKHVVKGSFSIINCYDCSTTTAMPTLISIDEEKLTSNTVMSSLSFLSFFIVFIVTIILTHSHYFVYCMKNIALCGIPLGSFCFCVIYFLWWTSLLFYSFFDPQYTVYRLGIWICLNISSSLLPITHNSLWVVFFNLSYERLLTIHKFMSILTVISVLIKLIVCIIYYSPDFFLQYRPLMGVIATCLTFTLFLLSLPYFRRKNYELFLYSHQILCISILIFSSLHYLLSLFYFLPFISLYLLDLFLRYKYTTKVDDWKITTIPGSLCVFLSVTLDTLKTKPKPACFYFIRVDKISRLELHPISLLFYDSNYMLFCIKDMGANSWSNQLRKMNNTDKTNIYIQGPYGHLPVDYKKNNYEYLFLIAGGIGVTPFPSIIKEIQELHYLDKIPKLKKIIFIWVIQEFVMIEQMRRFLQSDEITDIHIYITKDTMRNNTVYNYSSYSIKYKKPNIKKTIEAFCNKFSIKSDNSCVISCGPKGLCDDIQSICDEKNIILYNETYLK